jgi:hypothetical protein
MLSRIFYPSLSRGLKIVTTLILNVGRSISVRQSVDSRKPKNCPNSALRTMIAVDSILAGKYPAKAHARRVVEYIKKSKPDAQGVLYLEGQKTRMIEDNDEAQPFR